MTRRDCRLPASTSTPSPTEVGEFRPVDISLEQATEQTGIPYPNPHPYIDISLLVVAYNESERIGDLLRYLKEYFVHSVICVQESTDDTLEIVRSVMDRDTDYVLTDRHWGHGDASFPRMVRTAPTTWCFVVSCDEWPTTELLDSLSSAIAVAELDSRTREAVWHNFRGWIDDHECSESPHLRLFLKRLGWPNTLHSRPMTQRAIGWPHGYIEHRRSLDEMMVDYLSYYRVGKGHASWDAHNRAMMRDACTFVAARKGWDEVTKYEWWPEVRALAFGKETPWETP